MGKKRYIIFVLVFSGIIICGERSFGQKIFGFYPENSKKEISLEKRFKLIPSSKEIKKNLRILSEEAHMAGTPADYANAKFVKEKMIEYGIETKLDEYVVYLPYPEEIKLKMVEPEEKEFNLREQGWLWDKDSYDRNAVVPFNAYSASGNITSQLVYVNYGLPEDYRVLSDIGISVKGKIAIIRYGKCYRGVKVYLAEKNGASGVILYSDPADDGYMVGDIYPRGPMRPPSGVQRGSIKYMFYYPGDPLTPGWASIENQNRLNPEDAVDLPHIPCIPISYGNAKDLLKCISGPEVPQKWQGGLPFRYHIGPGPAKVNMNVKMEYRNRKIWNTIGRIEGTKRKDELVILGNHRDAWTFGAADPNSGTVVMLEIAKTLGKLLKKGFKPSRTIILATWDGEEFGIIGSTEWVENNIKRLKEKAILYLNVDTGVTGRNFGASATPSLRNFIRDVTKSVIDPATGQTVYEAWRKNQKIDELNKKKKEKIDTRIGILGSGSDFAAFFNFAGISSLGWSFGGKSGVYHSQFDNFYYMSEFGDPGFVYHPVIVKLTGIAILRFANCDILPLDYYTYAREVEKYVDDLGKYSSNKIDLSTVKEKVINWKNLCKELNDKIKVELKENSLSSADVDLLNEKLMKIERNFLNEDGLPGRSWYKHTIFAPGFHSGYSAITIPGVREAISNGKIDEAKKQLRVLSLILDNINTLTREAIEIF
ncbi:hypothetical protein DRQ09_08010 [candidate division KSB1 bacterium]|nr:MAG: hypothetical protein DRQ09_08010 [candidate division KSB1 bacterium]